MYVDILQCQCYRKRESDLIHIYEIFLKVSFRWSDLIDPMLKPVVTGYPRQKTIKSLKTYENMPKNIVSSEDVQ